MSDEEILESEINPKRPPKKRRAAREAFVSVRFYVLWGLFWSFLLLSAAELIKLFEPQEGQTASWAWKAIIPARFVIEHLGIGFIVSTVAVFFYEWGAHSKHVIELARDLVAELKVQHKIEKGQAHLRTMLRDDSAAVDVLNGLIKAVVDLDNSRSWGSDKYREVVLKLLEDLRKNSAALALLDKASDTRFIVPSLAANIIDAVLTAQMSAMGENDTYQVVSDMSSWQEGWLSMFREETKKAVTRGVKVQRVFNILNEDRHALSASAAGVILRQHLEDVEAWSGPNSRGSYELRIFGDPELRWINEAERGDIRGKHFGVFAHSNAEQISFEIHEHDLSDISISKNKEVIKKDVRAFEKIWGKSKAFRATDQKEQFIMEVTESFLNKDRSEIFNELKGYLEPDILDVFGEHFDLKAIGLRDMVEKKEVWLSSIDEYRFAYKKILKAYPETKFCATSLASTSYFWSGGATNAESVEESIKRFTDGGGIFERIFFTSGAEVQPGEEEAILRTQLDLGVKVFYIPRACVAKTEEVYFVAAENLKVAAEAGLTNDKIARVCLTFDRKKVAQYLHIFKILRGSTELRAFKV